MHVSAWTTPAPFFSWPYVQKGIDRIDPVVYRHSIKFAQSLYLERAGICPQCSRGPSDFVLGLSQRPGGGMGRGHGPRRLFDLVRKLSAASRFPGRRGADRIAGRRLARGSLLSRLTAREAGFVEHLPPRSLFPSDDFLPDRERSSCRDPTEQHSAHRQQQPADVRCRTEGQPQPCPQSHVRRQAHGALGHEDPHAQRQQAHRDIRDAAPPCSTGIATRGSRRAAAANTSAA